VLAWIRDGSNDPICKAGQRQHPQPTGSPIAQVAVFNGSGAEHGRSKRNVASPANGGYRSQQVATRRTVECKTMRGADNQNHA